MRGDAYIVAVVACSAIFIGCSLWHAALVDQHHPEKCMKIDYAIERLDASEATFRVHTYRRDYAKASWREVEVNLWRWKVFVSIPAA